MPPSSFVHPHSLHHLLHPPLCLSLDTNLSALVSHSTCRPPEPVYSTVNKLCDKAPSPRHYSPVECDKSLLHSAPIPNYHLSLFPDSDITRYFPPPPPPPLCVPPNGMPCYHIIHPCFDCVCSLTCSLQPRLDVCFIKPSMPFCPPPFPPLSLQSSDLASLSSSYLPPTHCHFYPEVEEELRCFIYRKKKYRNVGTNVSITDQKY